MMSAAASKKRDRESSGGEDSVFLERKEERGDSRKVESEEMMMVILEKINSAKIETEKNIAERIEKAKTDTVNVLKDEIGTIHSTLLDLQVANDKLTRDNERMKKEIDQHKGEINDLKGVVKMQSVQIQEFAQYSRSDNIKIYGLEEEGGYGCESEGQTARVVRGFLRRALGLTVHDNDISIAHRLQAREGQNKPRTIIVKFTKRTTKLDVLANRKKLKDSPVVIAEDLSPANMRLFHRMRDIAGNRNTWSHDGKILVKVGGETKRVTQDNVEEIEREVRERGSEGQGENRDKMRGQRQRRGPEDRGRERERGGREGGEGRAPRATREVSPSSDAPGGHRVRSLSLGHETLSRGWPPLRGEDSERDAWRDGGGQWGGQWGRQRWFGGGRGRGGGGRGRNGGGGGGGRERGRRY